MKKWKQWQSTEKYPVIMDHQCKNLERRDKMLDKLFNLREKFVRLKTKDGSLHFGLLKISEGKVKISDQEIPSDDIVDIEVVGEVVSSGQTGSGRPWYTL